MPFRPINDARTGSRSDGTTDLPHQLWKIRRFRFTRTWKSEPSKVPSKVVVLPERRMVVL